MRKLEDWEIVVNFWRNVPYGNPEECWEWSGYVARDGYGKTTTHLNASRFMYELLFGKVPDGIDICHSCDNRRCVNPHHLFAGTRKDNMNDCIDKGRFPFENLKKRHKLTVDEVLEIRTIYLHDNAPSRSQVAKEYGVARTTINAVVNRRTWNHVMP
jgi:hypothetical protein